MTAFTFSLHGSAMVGLVAVRGRVERMRRALMTLLFATGLIAPAGAVTCSVELSGSYRCDDGTTLKPDGQGGFRASNGTVLKPDGTGSFRSPNGLMLRQNGYGGLNYDSGVRATTGGSYGNPLQPSLNQGPDYASSRRVGAGGGYASPLPNRDCRPDAFGGYRCK